MRQPDPLETLATLTHARLRVRQGDYAAAVTLLQRLLEREPEQAEARVLLRSIEGRQGIARAEPAAEALRPPESAEASRLAGVFRQALSGAPEPQRRIRRLEEWLNKLRGRR